MKVEGHAGWTYKPFDGLWRAWCECGWRPERSWAYEYLARNDHRSHLIARLEAEMEGRRR